MSAGSIARWNAIPLERPTTKSTDDDYDVAAVSDGDQANNKPQYLRDLEGGQSSDDDVSIISRTPSPKPVDPMDITKFDEHMGAYAVREVITVETRIKSTNKGFALLAKMGWKEGTGLGLSDDARVDPVPFILKTDSTGIGKAAMDARVIEATVAQRRDLNSERLLKESEDQRKTREVTVAQKQTIKTELAQTLRPFYCEVCDKQYNNIAQYDEHCNSYAHAHKQRAKDVQDAERAKRAQTGEVDARKEKERKREEKELRKMAKAAGIKLPVTTAGLPAAPLAPTAGDKPAGGGFKKSGWASVSATTAPPASTSDPGQQAQASTTASSSGFKRAGWANVSSASASESIELAPENPATGFKRAGWASVTPATAAPASQSSGTGSSNIAPPPGRAEVQQPVKSGFKKIGFASSIGSTLAPPSAESSVASGLGFKEKDMEKEDSTAAAALTGPSASDAVSTSTVAPPRKHPERGRANWASFQRGAVPSASASAPLPSQSLALSPSTSPLVLAFSLPFTFTISFRLALTKPLSFTSTQAPLARFSRSRLPR
ncbi:hypothetical protein EXIGLDRAFT_744417 [Exidia glandulosa HHB12029]|uniref:G-patch domain-containing protein n=1 Tax=Exidia glandulosa HHB12029 TaxID=1314781 RepID=A0A165PBA0_EXIGL|nr:hypothetical protein EXIGLDRAFT_829510 [Exidia glandulosa HHB12029]KZW02525.1 hypothetical protein EXIGLDRAFT_744417 [Exidia glandulosa HHB12029]